MLTIGSRMINMPVLSLHVGGQTASTKKAIIDPEDLKVIAYILDDAILKNDPEIGTILDTDDIRESSVQGIVVDSSDRFVKREDVMKIDKVMGLDFDLIGLKVVDSKDRKIGKIVDYTVDTQTYMVYQLIVQRPFLESLIDPQLTINRSQIVEIDDFKVTIKHDRQKVKVPKKEEVQETFEPNFVNPFRKQQDTNYSTEESDDNSSNISE